MGQFLQEKLKLFTVDDPFRIQTCGQVTEVVRPQSDTRMRAFSIDIKDLYNSLPHIVLLKCIEENIYTFGVLTFQNTAGISSKEFLDLLSLYLTSTFVEWNEEIYTSRKRAFQLGPL